MFEDATFDSRGLAPSQTPRWMLVTFAVNGVAAGMMMVLPLLYPQAMPSVLFQRVLYLPPVARMIPAEDVVHPSRPTAAPAILFPNLLVHSPGSAGHARTPGLAAGSEESAGGDWAGDGMIQSGDGQTGKVSWIFEHAGPAVKQATLSAQRISRGVSEGLLLHRVDPSYPAMARLMRLSGVVTLEATISKNGTIEGLVVQSGNPAFRQAAMDAVKEWRYRPYLLNGEPVEVETTIEIHFTMGP